MYDLLLRMVDRPILPTVRADCEQTRPRLNKQVEYGSSALVLNRVISD